MSEWFHGFKAVIAGLTSLAALAAAVVGILVALDVIGGDSAPDNQPPIVGNITLDAAIPVAGQPVRAVVGVTDPDRDELVIQWTASAGRFPEGDQGKSVIYEPPSSGASFQLTAIISDRINEPVQSSENFVLAVPTPIPGQEPPTPQPTATPDAVRVAPAAQELAPAPPILTPTPTSVDISGIWSYFNQGSQGFLRFSISSGNSYDYVEYNAFGEEIGQGSIVREGDRYFADGFEFVPNVFTGFPELLEYTGELELQGPDSIRVSLRYQNGVFTELFLTRIDASQFP